MAPRLPKHPPQELRRSLQDAREARRQSRIEKPSVFEVFRSENLLARAAVGMSPDRCVVTFSPWEDYHSRERPGFGEGFFKREKLDAIHIIPNGNHWYQYPEFKDLCARVAALTTTYKHVVAYGSSMGGYAAARYGQWVGANVALALSPQYTVNPWRRPFDRRWIGASRRIKFLHEGERAAAPRAIVVFDSRDKDAKHANLFRELTDVVAVELPNSGHPCTGLLADLGVLESAILDVCFDRFDAEAFALDVNSRIESSPQFHIARARRSADPRRRFLLMTEAAERAPTHGATLLELAAASLLAAKPGSAIEALDRLESIEKKNVLAKSLRARALADTRHFEEAIAIMEQLCGSDTDSADFRRLLAQVRRRKFRHDMLWGVKDLIRMLQWTRKP